MIAVVILTCYLCDNWVYSQDGKDSSHTLHQEKFEVWLRCEAYAIRSYIFAGALYTFCCHIKSPTVTFQCTLLKEDFFSDFMDTNKVGLDMTINMCTPGLVGVGLSWFYFDG